MFQAGEIVDRFTFIFCVTEAMHLPCEKFRCYKFSNVLSGTGYGRIKNTSTKATQIIFKKIYDKLCYKR